MKWLLPVWILFVYALFGWNVLPSFYHRYAPLIKEKTSVTAQPQIVPQTKSNGIKISPPDSVPVPSKNSDAPLTTQKTPAKPGRIKIFAVNLLRISAALWIFTVACSFGKKILGFTDINLSQNTSAIFTALGLGVLSYLVLGMGFIGFLEKKWLFIFLAGLSILTWREILDTISKLKSIPSKIGDFSKSSSMLAFLTVILISLLLLKAFVPDQFFDSLYYHLALPQTYLNYGRIISLPHNFNSFLPQTMEMLFTLGLSLGGNDTIPLLLQLGCGILILATILSKGSRQDPFTLIAGLLWLTTPFLVENLRFSKNDILLSLWTTLAFNLIVHWKLEQGNKVIALAGIFCGFAMGTKYTGITLTFFLLLAMIWRNRNLQIRDQIKTVLIFCSTAFVIFVPWLIKNYFAIGNPLYPFLQNHFGFKFMRMENWRSFIGENQQFWDGHWRWLYLFKILWINTFYGHEFPSMNFIGPVWLAFLPVLVFYGLKSKEICLSSFFLLLVYVFSTTQTVLARYFFLPVLPIFSLSIARSVETIEDSGFRKKIFVLLMLGIGLQMIGWLPTIEQVSYGRTALIGLSEEKERKLYSPGYFDAFQWVNQNLSADSKILFVGEVKSHRFRRKVIAPSVHNEHPLSIWIRDCKTEGDLYRHLLEENVTHILFNRQEFLRLRGYPMFYFKPQSKIILETFWKNHLEEKYSNESNVIYHVTEKSPNSQSFPDELEQSFK